MSAGGSESARAAAGSSGQQRAAADGADGADRYVPGGAAAKYPLDRPELSASHQHERQLDEAPVTGAVAGAHPPATLSSSSHRSISAGSSASATGFGIGKSKFRRR